MKKILKSLLIFVLVFTIISLSSIEAAEITGVYNVTSTEEDTELWYNVRHTRQLAEASSQIVSGNAAGSGGGGAAVRGQLYPQQVNILEVPSSETVKIVPWTKFVTNSAWKLNTVKSMATDFENKNPGWKVIGAVNGDFFDIKANNPLPYQPNNTHASMGEFYKTTTGRSVGFRNDGSIESIVGGVAATRSGFKLNIYDSENAIIKEFDVNKVNQAPGEAEVSLYYSYYTTVDDPDPHKPIPIDVTPDGLNAYVVEEAERSLANSTDNFYGKGVISSVTTSTFNLTAGQFALVSNNSEVNANLQKDVTIRVQRIMTGAYEGINDFMGCGITLLKDSEPIDEDVNRHPRTVVGRKADGTIVLAVIDGRQPLSNMYGVTSDEMQALMAHYDCVDAYNLDGGGSSTLVILENGEFVVKNSPSDGSERADANCLLVVVKEPVINHQVTSRTTSKVSLSIDIVETNGHPIEKLFVKMNNEIKEVPSEGEIVFEGLESNTDYVYEFMYEDETEDSVSLISCGRITTAKKMPRFANITFDQVGSNLKITPNFNDPDFAVIGMYISINGTKYFTTDGIANVKNKTYSEEDVIFLYYEVILNDGSPKKVKTYYSPQFSSCVVLGDMRMARNELSASIFK